MPKYVCSARSNAFPAIPLRGNVLFPNVATTVELSRQSDITTAMQAVRDKANIVFVAQRDLKVDKPRLSDLYTVGCVASVRDSMSTREGNLKLMVTPLQRVHVLEYVWKGETLIASAEVISADSSDIDDVAFESYKSVCLDLCQKLMHHHGTQMQEFFQMVRNETDAGQFCDAVSSLSIRSYRTRQQLLETLPVAERMEALLKALSEEASYAQTERTIRDKANAFMEKANQEYFLREQIHAIQDELGDDDDEDIAELRKKIAESKMPDEVRTVVEKELRRLARTSVQAPESAISQNFIEYVLEMPWQVYTQDLSDIQKAKQILDEDHYGLTEIKERLVEFLAVRMITQNKKSPILCLVGPPGVGKTSIARSVARALDRKFVQMSLGGLHDEAEIRGHRKTYVGAMPGRIISSLHRIGSMNPVFLLDEIDKMAHDMRGDPSSALLEALDPEQNQSFRDHYLEAPFDLSDVLFITTANSTTPIDQALMDRMEVIEVSGYTLEEKIQIAKRHLMPKQLREHGLDESDLLLSDEAYARMILDYTREAGVRNLERTVAKLCRKIAVRKLGEGDYKGGGIEPNELKSILGVPVYTNASAEKKDTVGLVNGLAWTQVGGEVMPVEAAVFPGKGNLEITGNLGDVMKESARIAKSVARSKLSDYGLETDFFDKNDLHIHAPEGAVPKDGPSAGVALTCAILSAATGIKANHCVAMTGEISLHGKVLPIGGVKEKLLAAFRMGITDILLPRENARDLEKIERDALEKMHITLIDTIEDALPLVLPKKGGPEA